MDERLRFIARLFEGEKMAPLCREFGISRVTGYKIYERYKTRGLEGLGDRSRRPYRHANKLPYQVERTILGIKKEHLAWGAPRIRDKLIREVEEQVWLVSFLDFDLGFFDQYEGRVEPAPNPFEPAKVLTMSPE